MESTACSISGRLFVQHVHFSAKSGQFCFCITLTNEAAYIKQDVSCFVHVLALIGLGLLRSTYEVIELRVGALITGDCWYRRS